MYTNDGSWGFTHTPSGSNPFYNELQELWYRALLAARPKPASPDEIELVQVQGDTSNNAVVYGTYTISSKTVTWDTAKGASVRRVGLTCAAVVLVAYCDASVTVCLSSGVAAKTTCLSASVMSMPTVTWTSSWLVRLPTHPRLAGVESCTLRLADARAYCNEPRGGSLGARHACVQCWQAPGAGRGRHVDSAGA